MASRSTQVLTHLDIFLSSIRERKRLQVFFNDLKEIQTKKLVA